MFLQRGACIGMLLAAVLGAGCSKVERGVAAVFISDEDEAKLGKQVHAELEKQGMVYLEDPTVQSYVTQLTEKVLVYARQDRPAVDWHIHVVKADEVNAFAVPGGHLFVNTGLLLAAGNEAEVVGVLGHEAGHVVARHSARQMVVAYGLETVLAVALGNDPGTLEQIAAGIAANGALLAHSRADEHEADQYGARYASRAGYDPRGIIEFFQRLQSSQGSPPDILKWLSTHPAHDDRVEEVEAQIEDENLQGSLTNESQLQQIQAHLKTLSP